MTDARQSGYEKGMDPPRQGRRARVLFEMVELKGPELERCLQSFRYYYVSACELDDDRYWRRETSRRR